METLFAAGVGFILFTLASRFTDVREMYLVLVQTWFFLTPIVYHPSIVPPKYRLALWANPMYFLLQTFRKPIYDGVIPAWRLTVTSAGLAVGRLRDRMDLLLQPVGPSSPTRREVRHPLENVTVRYRRPRERIWTLKEYAIRKLKRRIFFDDFRALHDFNLDIAPAKPSASSAETAPGRRRSCG